MVLSQIVDQLKYGELRSMSAAEDMSAIVSYINLGLLALYSRFDLKLSEHIITLSENLTEYTLPPELMNIRGVYNELGVEFDLDGEFLATSVQQVDFETLMVPIPTEGGVVSVIYVPAPTWLVYIDETSLTLNVPIPPQLLEPLLHYIGYRAHSSMDGNIKAENNTHYMRFKSSCNQIQMLGTIRKAVVPASVSKKEFISEVGYIKGDSNE